MTPSLPLHCLSNDPSLPLHCLFLDLSLHLHCLFLDPPLPFHPGLQPCAVHRVRERCTSRLRRAVRGRRRLRYYRDDPTLCRIHLHALPLVAQYTPAPAPVWCFPFQLAPAAASPPRRLVACVCILTAFDSAQRSCCRIQARPRNQRDAAGRLGSVDHLCSTAGWCVVTSSTLTKEMTCRWIRQVLHSSL